MMTRHLIYGNEARAVIIKYFNNMSLQEIADEHYVATTTIRNVLIRNGIQRREDAKDRLKDEIFKLRKQDKSQREIASEVGVSQATVWRVLNRTEGEIK